MNNFAEYLCYVGTWKVVGNFDFFRYAGFLYIKSAILIKSILPTEDFYEFTIIFNGATSENPLFLIVQITPKIN